MSEGFLLSVPTRAGVSSSTSSLNTRADVTAPEHVNLGTRQLGATINTKPLGSCPKPTLAQEPIGSTGHISRIFCHMMTR